MTWPVTFFPAHQLIFQTDSSFKHMLTSEPFFTKEHSNNSWHISMKSNISILRICWSICLGLNVLLCSCAKTKTKMLKSNVSPRFCLLADYDKRFFVSFRIRSGTCTAQRYKVIRLSNNHQLIFKKHISMIWAVCFM